MKEQSEETQNHILDAAMKDFSKHGYQGSSISQIAKNAGVSKSLIFWYFKTKESLFQALLERFVHFCLNSLGIESPPGDATEKIEFLIDTYWKFIRKNFKFVRIFMNWFMNLKPSQKKDSKRLENLHQKFSTILEEYLNEGIKNGLFREDINSKITALYIISCLEGILLQMIINNLSFDDLGKEFFVEVKNNLLNGIVSKERTS